MIFILTNIFFAENGENGGSNNKKGKDGEDLIIEVPCGTVVKEIIDDKEVVKKKEIVVGNKIDLEKSKENMEKAKSYFNEIYFISALKGEGIKELLERIWRELND